MSEVALQPTFYEQLRVAIDKKTVSCLAAAALTLTTMSACNNVESDPATVSVEELQPNDERAVESSELLAEEGDLQEIQGPECTALAVELVIGNEEKEGNYIPPVGAIEPMEADLSSVCSEDRVDVEVDTGLGYSLPLSYELQDDEWVAVNSL